MAMPFFQKRKKTGSDSGDGISPPRKLNKEDIIVVSPKEGDSNSESQENHETMGEIAKFNETIQDIIARLERMENNQEQLKKTLQKQVAEIKKEIIADVDKKIEKLSTNVKSQMNRVDGQMKDRSGLGWKSKT